VKFFRRRKNCAQHLRFAPDNAKFEGVMTKSKAAIFEGIGQPLIIDEIEVDDPREGEVMIKLDATGLCHTEIWYMSGGDTSTRGGSVLGTKAAVWL
jgi:NADPH:quinone reductase-like Zn-dependent oxidoreductase